MDLHPVHILGEIDEDDLDLMALEFESDSEDEDPFTREVPISEPDVELPHPAFNDVCHTSLPVEVWERIMTHMSKDGIQTMSQVSRQHHALTKEVAFRSRYFLSQGMRCQAIFKASCFSKLFTPELLKCLLNMGAVMSRYFVQTYTLAHISHSPIRSRRKWAEGQATTTYLAVLTEGVARYGDTLKLSCQSTDSSPITAWINNPTRSLVLEDSIKEMFVEGKFAPFLFDDYQSGYGGAIISLSVSKHPDLVDILEENGYTFTKIDRDTIISDMFKKNDATEEELYKKVDGLLTRFPNWEISLSSCTHLLTQSFEPAFNAMPHTEEGRRVIAENDGIGPVTAPFKVMKRLYLEGKAFKDLDAKLVKHFKDRLSDPEYYDVPVAECRLFYRHFPSLLAAQRINIALAYIIEYKSKLTAVLVASDQKILRQSLFEMLKELDLSPIETIKVFSNVRVKAKLLHHALKADMFGSDWSQKIDKIICSLINNCIKQPRSGKRMEEIETVVNELHRIPVGKTKRDHELITKGFFAQELHRMLCTWAFDLDLLRPDKKNATEARFRTPIGWFVRGGIRVSGGRHYGYSCSLPFIDLYKLIPVGPPRSIYGLRSCETYFAHTQGLLCDFGGLEAEKEEEDEASRGAIQAAPKETPVGWSHLGHIDELTKAADDSGVCLMDEQVESDVVAEETATATNAEEVKEVAKDVSKPKSGPKLGQYNTIPIKFNRTYCSTRERDCYCGDYIPGDKGDELALALHSMLPADSPAMRDVLLAHALVNGNGVLVQKLMAGEYHGVQKKKVKKEPSSSHTQASDSSTPTIGGPVLPTLAHLRILQVLERRPVPAFTDRILEGAPFKIGYVKSTAITVRSKELIEEKRYEWYMKSGHRDDQSMTVLYAEKSRLEEMDAAAKMKARRKSAKAGAAKRKARRSTATRSEMDDDEEEFSAVVNSNSMESASQLRPQRSCRKAVKYSEPASTSSDAEDVISAENVGTSSKKVNIVDLFEEDMELTDIGSDYGQADQLMSGGTILDSDDSEEEAEDDDDYDHLQLYDEDVPMVDFKVGLDSYHMSLCDLIRRSKSIALWSEHLHLLEWFEQRKDKIHKEKMANVRKELETKDRAMKNDYFKWLEGFVREVDALKEVMEVQVEHAIEARIKALARKKRSAKLKELKKGSKGVEEGQGSKGGRKRKGRDAAEKGERAEGASNSRSTKRKRSKGDEVEVVIVEKESDISSRRPSRLARERRLPRIPMLVE